jgi:hypothetical protein
MTNMGRRELGIIETLGANVERYAGTAARAKVMEGAGGLAKSSGPAEVAFWFKGAMDRLDEHVAKAARLKIREACGIACAEKNKAMLIKTEGKRKKFKDIDALLAEEMRKPLTGTRLSREGNTLTWLYRPRTFSPPMRCFCSCMKGLPEKELVSTTYCLCSQGFAKKYWESALGIPVKVKLLESCLTGSPECKFVIAF